MLVDYDPRYESASCDEAYLNITKVSAQLTGLDVSADIDSTSKTTLNTLQTPL